MKNYYLVLIMLLGTFSGFCSFDLDKDLVESGAIHSTAECTQKGDLLLLPAEVQKHFLSFLEKKNDLGRIEQTCKALNKLGRLSRFDKLLSEVRGLSKASEEELDSLLIVHWNIWEQIEPGESTAEYLDSLEKDIEYMKKENQRHLNEEIRSNIIKHCVTLSPDQITTAPQRVLNSLQDLNN